MFMILRGSIMRTARSFAALLLCVFLATCDYGVLWEDDDYVLLWLDSPDQISLSRKLDQGSAIGRIEGNITAVGSNKTHVVAQLKPASGPVEYYLIDKSLDSDYAEPKNVVTGPLTSDEFQRLKAELRLPEFTSL